VATSFEHYQHAPIVEAIINLAIQPHLDQTALVELEELGPKAGYGLKSPRIQVTGQITVGPQSAASATQVIDGYMFRSSNGQYVLQATLGGITLSRLPPYDRWEPFRNEARRIWQLFAGELGERRISHLGVRYINQLELPAGAKMERYLATYPEIAHEIPQIISNYFMRVEIPVTDPDGILVIQQGLLPSTNPETVRILLDDDLRFAIPGDVDAWALLEQARAMKNQVFESCLRPEAKEMLR
jgi:uncharacterized protein (TIGR04255 family)